MQFTESEFTLRNAALHSRHCDYIERTGITNSEKAHFSTTYGVNRKSDLAGLMLQISYHKTSCIYFLKEYVSFIQQIY